MKHRTRLLLAPGLFAIACSASSDSGVTPPVNRAPAVNLLFTKVGVVRAIPVDISVAVSDADSDPVTLTWTSTRGALTPQNAAKTTMQWATPAAAGTDTVWIRATDGQVTTTVTVPIKVGYAANGQFALSLYEKAKSPYILAPSAIDPIVSIPEQQTTTIEAGTELLIDTPGATLDVIGTLVANGTSGEPVVIRPNDRTLKCGDERGWWEGIRGSTSSDGVNTYNGQINLTYAEVRYGQHAIRLRDGSNAVLNNCMIRCSGDAGVAIEGHGTLAVFDTEVSNGRSDGISVAAIASLPDSVIVRGCDIRINESSGIRLDINDAGKTVPIVIEYNKLEFNFTRGITLAHAVFPRIHFNHFSGNGVQTGVTNIYLENGYPTGGGFPQLDASCNYWGAPVSSQATIDGTIWDSLDSGSVGTRVITSPWLNESPLTTPPVCTPPAP